MGIAPEPHGFIFTQVFPTQVQTADKGFQAIYDQDFAVITKVNMQVFSQALMAIKTADLGTGTS